MRPLGMGSTGRKLVSAALLATNAKEIHNEFFPFQLSYAVKNGCEAVVHFRRRMHELRGNTHVIITLDVSNAFNSVSRLQGLLSIAQALPEIYTHANQTYKRINKLWMDGPGEATRQPIKAQEGSTQGAVDGGTFFNMAMRLKRQTWPLNQGGMGQWSPSRTTFLDVTPTLARRVLDIVTQRFQTLRLKIINDKCWVLADTTELLQRVDLSGNPELERIKTTLEGIKVLGAAI